MDIVGQNPGTRVDCPNKYILQCSPLVTDLFTRLVSLNSPGRYTLYPFD